MHKYKQSNWSNLNISCLKLWLFARSNVVNTSIWLCCIKLVKCAWIRILCTTVCWWNLIKHKHSVLNGTAFSFEWYRYLQCAFFLAYTLEWENLGMFECCAFNHFCLFVFCRTRSWRKSGWRRFTKGTCYTEKKRYKSPHAQRILDNYIVNSCWI